MLVGAALAAALPALVLAAAGSGCGESTFDDAADAGGADADAGDAAHQVSVTLHPDAAPLPGETKCEVVVTHGIKIPGAKHVDPCTPVKYATNPPSGGDHWPIWAAFKAYTIPVPREMYVHDMEHGGVVLAYRCSGACPDVVAMLTDVEETTKADPACIQAGIKARVVLTPDPKLETPVAAAAWGSTYVATCLDPASLKQFVKDSYGKGTENICGGGLAIDELDGGALCADGG